MEFHNSKHDCRLPEATFVKWILNVLQKSVAEKNLSANIRKQFLDKIMTDLGNRGRSIFGLFIFLNGTGADEEFVTVAQVAIV